MSTLINCPFCESARLTEQDEIAEFNDRKNGVRLPYYKVLTECLDCNERFESPAQRLENGNRITEARSVARGAPTAAEIRKLRTDWKLTIAQAGALFGGGEVAFAKYEKGVIVPVQSMSKLLRLAIAGVIKPESLHALSSGVFPAVGATIIFPIAEQIDRSKWKRYATRANTVQPSTSPYLQADVSTAVVMNIPERRNPVMTDNPLFSTPFSDVIYESTRIRSGNGAPNK